MNVKIVANNKKAYHDYFVEDTFETGIELMGSEVKSIRMGNVNLKDNFCYVKDGELYVVGMHVSPYTKGSFYNPDAKRNRRLLMHKSEIRKLRQKVEEKGYTLALTKLYLKGGLIKTEIALCRGKEGHDKRDALKEKEQKREIQRYLKEVR